MYMYKTVLHFRFLSDIGVRRVWETLQINAEVTVSFLTQNLTCFPSSMSEGCCFMVCEPPFWEVANITNPCEPGC